MHVWIGMWECGFKKWIYFSLLEDDVEVIFGGLKTDGSALIPSAVHLPKVDSPHHLFEFADMFAKVISNMVN